MANSESTPTYTYAIVGGGIAAVSCVEQILEYDPIAQILLISSSSVVKEATAVTHLTKTLQDFVLVQKSLKSFKDVHQSVDVVHDHVTGIDGKAHTLTTAQGRTFRYGKLCLCMGGRPRVLFPQFSKFVLGIRDSESVGDLAARISKARRILLLGNGGIATEFVHEVEGVEIYWAIKDQSISAQFVDPGAAEFFIQAKLADLSEGGGVKSQNKDDEEESSPEKRSKMEKGVDLGSKNQKSSSKSKPVVTKRQQYMLSEPAGLGDVKVEGVSEPGSALGPDWHRELHLRGLSEKKNVKILYETECTNLFSPADQNLPNPENWPIMAELSNATHPLLGVDLIISATGVLPNCGWTREQKPQNNSKDCNSDGFLEQDEEKGIFVNSSMQTSLQDIFAAGDVCYPNWKWSKHWFQMRLWTQARQMGLYAGKCMYLSHLQDLSDDSSEEAVEEPDFCFEIFSHVTKFFGFKVVLLGLYNGQGLDPSKLELLIRCTKGVEYIKLVLEGGRLQGAILIGETGLEETFENLILNQVDLSPYGEDLLNPDIDIEDYFD